MGLYCINYYSIIKGIITIFKRIKIIFIRVNNKIELKKENKNLISFHNLNIDLYKYEVIILELLKVI
ncbi:hypothetical protein CLOBY_35950 [Clostridium saccharobutylicum]|nr:hypothetical protein CLOSC_36680 [Clostridium saccharobutylicum]OAV41035.1 hypothetical protein M945_1523 [Clostridium saccharobutylicum DSM 13864]AQS01842.1 hypothetical protein CSACC_36730 [Clostridium saccharobutylicum]AQS11439.1 hypothetical protein CLOBY_35950 [Clostridium saccharobutylicum]AQS15825.1 hypothetical protein CLOSACC_36730 [Clostridium saccharobutylicum]